MNFYLIDCVLQQVMWGLPAILSLMSKRKWSQDGTVAKIEMK